MERGPGEVFEGTLVAMTLEMEGMRISQKNMEAGSRCWGQGANSEGNEEGGYALVYKRV
jgi:hypothetical protein